MRKSLTILILLPSGCGAGDGTNNDREQLETTTVTGSNINITANDGATVNVNQQESGDGQTNDTLASGNQLDDQSDTSSPANEDDLEAIQALYAPDIDLDQVEACIFCCTPENEVSEASCVDATEGVDNEFGDCPGELLAFAGCSDGLVERSIIEQELGL